MQQMLTFGWTNFTATTKRRRTSAGHRWKIISAIRRRKLSSSIVSVSSLPSKQWWEFNQDLCYWLPWCCQVQWLYGYCKSNRWWQSSYACPRHYMYWLTPRRCPKSCGVCVRLWSAGGAEKPTPELSRPKWCWDPAPKFPRRQPRGDTIIAMSKSTRGSTQPLPPHTQLYGKLGAGSGHIRKGCLIVSLSHDQEIEQRPNQHSKREPYISPK